VEGSAGGDFWKLKVSKIDVRRKTIDVSEDEGA